jgi:hypothetical protein
MCRSPPVFNGSVGAHGGQQSANPTGAYAACGRERGFVDSRRAPKSSLLINVGAGYLAPPASGSSQMKISIFCAAATWAIATLLGTPVQAANVPAWCANSGYDNGPPRSRGPGTGPSWQGEPTDCKSIWRCSRYRGTDPDPDIRLQLMRYRPASKKERRVHRN